MAATGVKHGTKRSIQLVAFTVDNINFYYGELHDDHVLRGSARSLYASNFKIVDMTTEWKSYLCGRVLEIEQGESKWIKGTITSTGHKYMLQHDSGYLIPLIGTNRIDICKYFTRIAPTAPMKMPSQRVGAPAIVEPPTIRGSSHVYVKARKRDDDADSVAKAIVNGDEDPEDEGKKERDALSAAVIAASRRRRSVSFK